MGSRKGPQWELFTRLQPLLRKAGILGQHLSHGGFFPPARVERRALQCSPFQPLCLGSQVCHVNLWLRTENSDGQARSVD